MKLHRLRLVNFRQHADTEIAFGDGITGIIGPNGSGKTSLLEAIAGLRPGARGRIRIAGRTWLDSANGFRLPPEDRGVGSGSRRRRRPRTRPAP